MKKIHIITSNEHKIKEFKDLFKDSDIEIGAVSLDLPEIQSQSQEEVLKNKLSYAWEKLKKPLIVDDTGFYIDKYNNFPGTITKFVLKGIGVDGLMKLTNKKDLCYFKTLLGYRDQEQTKLFEGLVYGTIDFQGDKKELKTKKLISDVFIPSDNNQNNDLLYDSTANSHRKIATLKFIKYLEERK